MRFRHGTGWLTAASMVLIGALAAVAAVAQPADEEGKEFTEYEVKAAFLVNFAKYVEWPERAFPEPESPFKIGVMGPDPFGDTLERLTENQKLNGRSIAVERSDDVKELTGCQIVFLSGPDRKTTPAELEALKASLKAKGA